MSSLGIIGSLAFGTGLLLGFLFFRIRLVGIILGSSGKGFGCLGCFFLPIPSELRLGHLGGDALQASIGLLAVSTRLGVNRARLACFFLGRLEANVHQVIAFLLLVGQFLFLGRHLRLGLLFRLHRSLQLFASLGELSLSILKGFLRFLDGFPGRLQQFGNIEQDLHGSGFPPKHGKRDRRDDVDM